MRSLISVLVICLSFCSVAQDRFVGKPFVSRSEVLARNGMVAASQPLAAITAIDILKSGGNAIDAAIAANAVEGLVEPTGNGIGGDLFAIVWDNESKKLYGLNASGRSPKSLKPEEFQKRGLEEIPYTGVLPISVPGCVDGWFELHQRFGSKPMNELLAPAVKYAREGFPVSETIAYFWSFAPRYLKDQPGFTEVFLPGGKPPAKGEIFRNPALANTLEEIGKEGRDVFYKGSIAREIAAFVKEAGGFLSYEDLASHKSEWVEPVSANYRGYDLWELPPNGQGIAALQILNILEGYDIASMGFGSAEYIHLFIEAKKLAYEDRAKFYADPDFHEIPVEKLVSKAYANNRRELIDREQAALEYEAGDFPTEHGETIYLTVADKEGNMVSLIQSNFAGFGSGITPPDLGFCLQNRGQLFKLEKGHFNTYAPGKRPFHTIIPAFVTKDGEPLLSHGVTGGAMHPQGHVQVLVNIIDFGMNIQEAGDAPRVQHTGSSGPTGGTMTDGGWIHLENGFSEETIRELTRKGHRVRFGGFYGFYQAIKRDSENKVYYGASESRTDGQAIGY